MTCYEEYEVKPIFDISENNIGVTLPVVDRKKEVNSDEMIILEILSKGIRLSSSELVLKSGFGKNKVVRLSVLCLKKTMFKKKEVAEA